jgi:hypothetical protein
VTFGGSLTSSTVAAWKAQTSGTIFYEASATPGAKKSWTAKAAIPGARTNTAPAITSYRDPYGNEAVLAVWRGASGGLIHYAQGEVRAGRKLSWNSVATLPKSIYNTTDTAPAVYFAQDRYLAVIAYRGPYDHVRYIIGTPHHRGFTWSSSSWVSASAVSGSSPTIAELQTSTGHGTIYVFWKDNKSSQVSYATTPDPLTTGPGLTWSAVTALTGSVTGAGPAAASVGPHGTGPLLLAYKAPHSTSVLYRTLSGGTWSPAAVVPSTSTTYGPALLGGELATTSSSSAGNIFLHIFS